MLSKIELKIFDKFEKKFSPDFDELEKYLNNIKNSMEFHRSEENNHSWLLLIAHMIFLQIFL